MKTTTFLSILVTGSMMAGFASWLAEKQFNQHDYRAISTRPPAQVPQDSQAMPLSRILQQLELPRGSRILEIEQEYKDGSLHYELELLSPQGHVYELRVDARNGKTIELKQDQDEENEHAPAAG